MPAPDTTAAPTVERSPLGRRAAAASMTVFTGIFIWFGGSTLHREVYAERAPNPLDRDCGSGIQRLRSVYAPVWLRVRDGGSVEVELAQLDGDLRGLRGLCAREGGAGPTAFGHLERWRYRSEDQARSWRETVGDEAGLALGHAGNSR